AWRPVGFEGAAQCGDEGAQGADGVVGRVRPELVYQTEKFLKDNEDKVPAEVKTEVESAVEELKAALKGEDTAEIRTATEKVAAVSQKVGQAMYADAQAAGAGAEGAEAGGAKAADDDVVDAEIVDDERKDGAA
ncbi:Hsp70 family protein, partial [Streptomyces nigra]